MTTRDDAPWPLAAIATMMGDDDDVDGAGAAGKRESADTRISMFCVASLIVCVDNLVLLFFIDWQTDFVFDCCCLPGRGQRPAYDHKALIPTKTHILRQQNCLIARTVND